MALKLQVAADGVDGDNGDRDHLSRLLLKCPIKAWGGLDSEEEVEAIRKGSPAPSQ